jgi:PAS domain S-box-containing protein
MATMHQQTELRCALEAKLEMAEEAMARSNCNIQLTIQILIQSSTEIEPLLVKRAENSVRIGSLVQQIRELVQSDDERQLLDAAGRPWAYAHDHGKSLPQILGGQNGEDGVAMADAMLPLILDNSSWKAFVEFLRAQTEFDELNDETKLEMTNRTRDLVRANQHLKSIVAERKRVEERRSQLESIIEFANDAIMICTLGGTIVSWNMGAETIYGYSASEALGRSRYMLVPPDQLDEVSGILKRLESGERIRLHEEVNIRKDGKRINVSMTVSPVKDASGTIVGVAAITRDISDRNSTERMCTRI